jgi:hypothetical protein
VGERTNRSAASGGMTPRTTLASVPEGQHVLSPLPPAMSHFTPRANNPRSAPKSAKPKPSSKRLAAEGGGVALLETSPPQLGMQSARTVASSAYPSEGESPGKVVSCEGDRLVVDAILAAKQAAPQVSAPALRWTPTAPHCCL